MSGDLTVLQTDALSLAVAPLGAEMQYLRTAEGGELLWHGDPAHWSGRSPILFPIVGRAVDDTIAVGDHSAAMPQHGFARRSLFTLVEASDGTCVHRLTDTEESRIGYPFAFVMDVTHRLTDNTLDVEVQVTNKSVEPMPFGFGFHPAFNWPLPQAEGSAHYVTLEGGGEPNRVTLHDGLLRRQPVVSSFVQGDLQIKEELFTDGALVFPNGANALRYGPRAGPSLAFAFKNLPDLALWRPTNAPFLCIEPWHGTASYVGDGPQIAKRPNSIVLNAGQSADFGCSVTFSR